MNHQRRRSDDSDSFETIVDRYGRKVKVLKDGCSARVTFRDAAASRAQHSVNDGRRPLTDADRQALKGCQPGFRTVADSQRTQRRAAVDAAYQEHEHRLVNAWRDGPNGAGSSGAGSGSFRGQRPGDSCTVRGAEFPDDFGSPGVLRERNGSLVCVPLDSDNGDVFDARRKKYVSRDPAGRVLEETEETEEAAADSAFALNQGGDAQQRAYDDYARELSQRWRRG
jgi:hypothetical protein